MPYIDRESLLRRLTRSGLDEESIAKSIGQLIRGEKVTTRYKVASDGELVAQSVTVSSDSKSVARGLLVADALLGGELGLSTRAMTSEQPTKEVYAGFLGSRKPNPRVIATIVPVSEPEPEPDDGL